jgi:hypothetical protein
MAMCTMKNLAALSNGCLTGVDIMITIFCDFFPISGEKIGVFRKYQFFKI